MDAFWWATNASCSSNYFNPWSNTSNIFCMIVGPLIIMAFARVHIPDNVLADYPTSIYKLCNTYTKAFCFLWNVNVSLHITELSLSADITRDKNEQPCMQFFHIKTWTRATMCERNSKLAIEVKFIIWNLAFRFQEH